MERNILKESEVTKIYLSYQENGIKKRHLVSLRFMDLKDCYFATPMPQNFKKPKNKTPIEIVVYTTDGVYTTHVSLIESNISMSDVLFSVTIPKSWDFKQWRQSTRKRISINFSLKYNDGFEIVGTTYDISIGGISFITDQRISSVYEKMTCIASIQTPDNLIINFPDKKLVTEAKFVRKKENFGEYGSDGTLYAFKFIQLSGEEESILKGFLLSIK